MEERYPDPAFSLKTLWIPAIPKMLEMVVHDDRYLIQL
jgi:hypothetical protein